MDASARALARRLLEFKLQLVPLCVKWPENAQRGKAATKGKQHGSDSTQSAGRRNR
jgi:hypothetical protein